MGLKEDIVRVLEEEPCATTTEIAQFLLQPKDKVQGKLTILHGERKVMPYHTKWYLTEKLIKYLADSLDETKRLFEKVFKENQSLTKRLVEQLKEEGKGRYGK